MLTTERALPSKGMTLNQLQAVFGTLGQPALFYGLERMPRVVGVPDPSPQVDANGNRLPAGLWDTRLFSVCCRYLNSGYPVLIATTNHAFVLVGWYRRRGQIRVVVNDDQEGPYRIVGSPFTDPRGAWRSIMVPLPPRVFLSGEASESRAHNVLRGVGSAAKVAPLQALASGITGGSISLRTILRGANTYKDELPARGLHDDAIRLLRLARLPRFVWVVEAHDRAARERGDPPVVAEVLLDSTSHDLEPRIDALVMPGVAVTYPPGGVAEHAPNTLGRWESLLSS
jgi:hypothetical protein